MTDLVKVEKRKGRWVRADTGEPLTCEELHRAYYLEAITHQIACELAPDDMVIALTLSDRELGQFIEFERGQNADLGGFVTSPFFDQRKRKPTAAERAAKRWAKE